jgi:hypothetical protein
MNKNKKKITKESKIVVKSEHMKSNGNKSRSGVRQN